MKFQPRFWYFLLAILTALAIFYKMDYMALSADEPIRALIALDIWLNNHYFTPELNGDLYLNKPPLYNWLLVGLFALTDSTSEWVIRLPNHLAMILFGFAIYRVVLKEYANQAMAVICALAFVTTGNLWFYSGYLGHIDVLYSLIVFVQIYSLYRSAEGQWWWKFYFVSYALTSVGFLMKGLPSLAFQAISILTLVGIHKQWKKLFHPAHFLGILLMLLPISIYAYFFSKNGDLVDLANRLFFESASRTVGTKSFLKSIEHLFTFPFQFLADTAPWSLAGILLFKKDIRDRIKSHRFSRIISLLFLTNLVIYWLSPDYRARYVFMLMPLFLTAVIYGTWPIINERDSMRVWLNRIVCLLAIVFITFFMSLPEELNPFFSAMIIGIWVVLEFLFHRNQIGMVFSIALSLIAIRFTYSEYAIPYRMELGPYAAERELAEKHAEMCEDKDVFMYHSNLALTQNWYFSEKRRKMLITKRDSFDLNAYYYVPTDVITDPNNVITFDTFVRRFGQKPFYLLKFQSYFPPMPKKREP